MHSTQIVQLIVIVVIDAIDFFGKEEKSQKAPKVCASWCPAEGEEKNAPKMPFGVSVLNFLIDKFLNALLLLNCEVAFAEIAR